VPASNGDSYRPNFVVGVAKKPTASDTFLTFESPASKIHVSRTNFDLIDLERDPSQVSSKLISSTTTIFNDSIKTLSIEGTNDGTAKGILAAVAHSLPYLKSLQTLNLIGALTSC